MRRTSRVLATTAAALLLAACGGGSPSEDPFDQKPVDAPDSTPETEIEVVTDWQRTDNPGTNDTFVRVVLVNGECFVEEYHSYAGSTAIASADEACDR